MVKMQDSSQNHDDMLFEMLKDCKTLPNFFDDIFGFLQRRTDFYHVNNDPAAAVGLPDGLAEKLLRHSFYKWKPQPQVSENISSEPVFSLPVTSKEIVQLEEVNDVNIVTSTTEELVINNENEASQDKDNFTKSESYNGAVFKNYCWSQSISDIDILIHVPENILTKDLDVTILSNKICVELKDGIVLLNGNLCQKCKATDAIWSLDKRKLEIHLTKCQDVWWNCLIIGEPELDLSKIDCSRPYQDLPEEAQVKIEELQWNQERKKLGLPTSEELVLREKLKKAWSAEGSPFSGPFDPNVVNFN